MSPRPVRTQQPHQLSLAVRLGQAFRRYFVAGLATLVPVVVTVWILVKVFNWADQLLGRHLPFQMPGLGLVVTVLLVVVVGFLTSLFGRVMFRVIEVWFYRLPIARKIYPAVKQLTQFLFGDQGGEKRFRRAVLVQYPRLGVYSIGFVTNEVQVTATQPPMTLLVLLIPQPPSPLTGPIIFVPEAEVVPVDLSIEDAVKLVMSGGVLAKSLQAPPPSG